MGIRFRKSFNLGGGFRVNISKSGIGYSWGVKGLRITKKANGGIRTTTSIPGTGLSYVKEYTDLITDEPVFEEETVENIVYQAKDVNISDYRNEYNRDFLNAIGKYYTWKALSIWGIVISFLMSLINYHALLLTAIFLFMLIVSLLVLPVDIEYNVDDYGKKRSMLIDEAITTLANNNKVWKVDQVVSNNDLRRNAGASTSISRKEFTIYKGVPSFLCTNARCYNVKVDGNEYYLLQDRLIVKNKQGWGAIELNKINFTTKKTCFIETGLVPNDAKVVGSTWLYVNKDGSPDKRFSGNREVPECEYGEIEFTTNDGFSFLIQMSNVNAMYQIREILLKLKEKEN